MSDEPIPPKKPRLRVVSDPPSESTGRRTRRDRSADFARGDHVELGQRMLSMLSPDRDDLVGEEGLVHRYDEAGLFRPVDRGEQSRIVQGFAGMAAGEKGKPLDVSASDVGGALRLAYDQVDQGGLFFAGAPAGLAFRNEYVRVTASGIERRPHSRENRARAGYTFDFNPALQPKLWLRFLREVFEGESDVEERIAFLQEWMGAAMLGIATKWELCLVLIGSGSNGKSVVIRIAKAVMPDGTTQAIEPQLWGDQYRRAALRGCRLNVVPELPAGDILASSAFKAIITGDPIDARPIREAPFTLRAIAGHLFAANQLPGTRDLTEAFWRRMAVMRFGRTFERSVADVDLADRIIAQETPALVPWFLAGAARLLARGRFEIPRSSHAEVRAWKARADAVSAFLTERCVDASGADRETCGYFYERFRSWAENQGFQVPSARTVGDRMVALGKGSAKGAQGAKFYPVQILPNGVEKSEDEEGPCFD